MKQILYADDLVLMGETMEELRENFDEWREAFESKGMRVNLGKTKLMVRGMEEETLTVRLILAACVENELCLTRCYVQHVVSGSTQDALLKKKAAVCLNKNFVCKKCRSVLKNFKGPDEKLSDGVVNCKQVYLFR